MQLVKCVSPVLSCSSYALKPVVEHRLSSAKAQQLIVPASMGHRTIDMAMYL